MHIYLASRYGRLEELQNYRDILKELGHTITSRWVDGNHQWSTEQQQKEAAEGRISQDAYVFADEDLHDLLDADTLISFTEHPTSGYSRGGRHVEFGMALGWNAAFDLIVTRYQKRLIVVGPRENVFHNLPSVEAYETWEEFLREVL